MSRCLIVRFSAIGDVVMSVPVAVSIRKAIPECEIWWVAEKPCEQVLDTPSLIHTVVESPRLKNQRFKLSAWRTRLAAYARLRHADFEFGLDLQGQVKTAVCLRVSGARKRLSVPTSDGLAARLNPCAKFDIQSMHAVEVGLKTLTQLGAFEQQPEWQMPSLEGETKAMSQHIDRKLVTISVGGSFEDKRYPIEMWSQVAQALTGDGFNVAFLGGPGDPEPTTGLNLVGKTSLRESMALVKSSALHLAADTGTGHIAAAYGVPVVSIFGPTNATRFRPYSDRGVVLQRERDPASVPVEDVISAAKKLLEAHANTH
ncbi:MAG: glycosyltransferase family 9 protein [Armatimonadetes bacterium]|nr:glycosyltransferase family 9 protein [Armatimonadota bacterium]